MRTSNKILLGAFFLILLTITIIIIKLGNEMKVTSSPEPDEKSAKSEKLYNLPRFNKIEIDGRFIVHYTQDTFQKVTVRGDANLIDQSSIEVKYGKLSIHTKNHFGSRHHINVYVTTDSINEIESRAGATFKTINQLKVFKIAVSSEAGAKTEMNGDFTNLSLDFSAGSVGEFSGTCKNLEINSSSGSVINADNILADNCKISTSSGAVSNINVKNELSLEASSGSIVKCHGDPKIKDINISSGAQFIK